MSELLTPREVDLIFRYPPGRTTRLAKAGKIEHIVLPDGEIRIAQSTVERLATPVPLPASSQEVLHAQAG